MALAGGPRRSDDRQSALLKDHDEAGFSWSLASVVPSALHFTHPKV
jgi:hypothetical protein